MSQICLACAADATFRRMLFAEQRFLVPGERISLGVETRTDRAHEDWHRTVVLGVNVAPDQFGMFRRRVRLAGEGRRYLDAGEPLRSDDQMYDDEKPEDMRWGEVPARPSRFVEANTHLYRRAMYANFPMGGCRCEERAPIARTEPGEYGRDTVILHDPPEDASPAELARLHDDAQAKHETEKPSICTKCGRVWAVLDEGQRPEAEYTELSAPDPNCRCDEVDAVRETDDAGKRADIIAALQGRGPPARVRCLSCGQVWLRDAWVARFAIYPDLLVNNPADALGPTDRRYGLPARPRPQSPRQAEALQRTLYAYELVRWKRFRDRSDKLFGPETTKGIDKSFADIEGLIQRRATGVREAKDAKEPLLLADTDAVLHLVHEQLDHLEAFFKCEAIEAQEKRLSFLNAKLVEAGGPLFYKNADDQIGRHQTEAETAALDKVGAALGPIVAKAKFLNELNVPKGAAALVNFVGVDGTELKRACEELRTSDDKDVAKLAGELLELVSPYEVEDKSLRPTLSADIVEAVTPDKPKRKSVTPQNIPYLILPPEMEIRAGDFWEDPDVVVTDYGDPDHQLPRWTSPITKKHNKLRPCVATVGKQVPWPPSLPREGVKRALGEPGTAGLNLKPGETVEFARQAVSPWRRSLDTPFPEQFLEAPDPYKEHRMYLAFGGLEQGSEPLPGPEPEATASPFPKDVKVTSLEDFEAVLRALYVATGMNVQSFAIDKEHRVARLILVTAAGPKVIAVPIPPDIKLPE